MSVRPSWICNHFLGASLLKIYAVYVEFVVKIDPLQDAQGDAQAHALQYGQGRVNRSAIGNLSPYYCDNELKLPPDTIYKRA